MWKRPAGVFLATAAVALTFGVGAASASASAVKTWTVKPGGAVTGKSGTTILTDKNTHSKLTCKSSKTTATLKKGSKLPGAGIASVKSATFSSCKGPLGLMFKVKTSHLPWKLNAVSYKSGVTHGTITGIHATLSGPGCSAVVDGTSATANNGKVSGTYTNKTHKLAVLASGGNLHVYKVSGCAGLIKTGDATTFTASYAITPGQTITSP